jgi:hypothetical protein
VRRGLVLVLVLVALGLVGCGGGGGGGGSSSAAEFRQQADGICAKYEAKITALGTPTSLDELGDFVDQAVSIIEQGNNELQSLEPPDELADDWDRAMQIQGESLQTTRDLQDAIHNQDDAKVQELLGKLDAAQAESTQVAQRLGLENCGRSSGGGTTTG